MARDTAGRIAARISRGEGFPDGYAYGERPLREEVVREFPGQVGDPVAAITRNSYGALILNTASVAFLDVDLPPEPAGESLPRRFLRRLRGKPAPERPDPTDQPLRRLREWLAEHPRWGVRVYRTHSGLRYLLTHADVPPDHPEIQSAMHALGTDIKYRHLCRAQGSYRARLTPKPWRIGLPPPPARFPWSDAAAERAMIEWRNRYDDASRAYATCRFLTALGNPAVDPDVETFRVMHDTRSRASSALPLA